jgi:hypothetical protein
MNHQPKTKGDIMPIPAYMWMTDDSEKPSKVQWTLPAARRALKCTSSSRSAHPDRPGHRQAHGHAQA